MNTLKTTAIKPNPDNPRIIRDDKFKQLVKSLTDFPEMLQARPIVVNPENVVLGGNMRLKACIEAGIKEVPVYVATWDEIKQKQFIIKDNVSFGEWDWDMLANEWDNVSIADWGLDVWVPEADVDYSILDEEFGDLDERVTEMKDSVKRALQIEFSADDYALALELTGKLRKQNVYVGGIIIEALSKCAG
jgi:ParB-like chromosome segregation protein Spo0J